MQAKTKLPVFHNTKKLLFNILIDTYIVKNTANI